MEKQGIGHTFGALFVVLLFAACGITELSCSPPLPTVAAKSGTWSLAIKRAVSNGAAGGVTWVDIAGGTLEFDRELSGTCEADGDSSDSAISGRASLVIADGTPSHDGVIHLEAGQYLGGGTQRRVWARILPGCCAPDGNGWQEFMVRGVLLNNSEIDGVADGSGFDAASVVMQWAHK